MFECKYKFTLEDSIISAKYVYRSQQRKRDKIIAVLVPILIVFMTAMLIFDVVKNRSIVWDLILLILLVILEVVYLLLPVLLVSSQKKSFKKQNLEEVDFLNVVIDSNSCIETLIKGEEEIGKTIHNLKTLTSYLEDNDRLILVFNDVEYTCLRKDKITGSIEKLKALLMKSMSKAVNGAKKR